MDSLKSNIEEIPNETTTTTTTTITNANHENENVEEITPPTPSSVNAIENTIATAATTTAITATTISNSNQETELAAMSSSNSNKVIEETQKSNNLTTTNSSSSNSTPTTTTTTSTNTDLCETRTTTTINSFNQFVTPQKPENKSIQSHASTSLKKKRNKFSKCLINDNNQNANSGSINSGGDIIGGDHDSSSSLSNVLPSSSNIKTSLSMTSLPPDEKQENRDGIKAKLKVERPYNSLKKNTDRNLTNQLANMHSSSRSHASNSSSTNKYNRYSWGSGHSSSSLHSSAATLGIGSGKDDLWAAIQTNYNYIMDTNLLDTCKEARCEIEGATSVLDNTMDKSFKLLDDNNRNVGSCEDPKELRKWLRDMEHKLENAPTLSEATMLTCAELESHLNEHSVLYHEIVSHARIVSACIRAASEKEQQQLKQQQQQQQVEQQQQLQHDSYNTDASLIAEQTNSSLSSSDDTTTTTTTTNATTTNNTNTTSTTSGVVCGSTASSLLSDPQISPNSTAATGVTVHPQKKSDVNNLERLQNRYHLLYLKAFEVQLWLDGLLRKKSSSVGNLTNEDLDSEDIDDSIDYSDDCLVNDEDGATEDDINDVASDLESDITHNSLSYNDEDLQQQQHNIYNTNHNNHQQQQQQLQHHLKKQQKQQQQQQIHQHCHSSDIDENQTINVSSHHQHQLQQQQQQKHPQSSSRDCIQTKLLKSAEVSSDDEGWLYTSAPVATNAATTTTTTFGGIESLNSNHFSRGIVTSNEIHIIDGIIQSSTVSSSTTNATSVVLSAVNATDAAASAIGIVDDSDKEIKEACTSSLTQIRLTTNQTFVASTTVVDSNSGSSSDSISDCNTNPATAVACANNPRGSRGSSSSITSSSYSSNDRLTEATTTTSTKTITTQILKYPMPQHQQQQHHPQYRSEMELQINNNKNINNNNNQQQQIILKENILTATNTTNMPHLNFNHNNSNNNNNCANSLSPSSTTNYATTTSNITLQNSSSYSPTTGDNDANGNFEKENIRFYTRADICNISVRTPNQSNDINNHYQQHQQQQQQLANINGSPASSSSSPLYGHNLLHVNVGKRLPPRSPAKSSISHTSTNTSTSTISPTKGKVSHESIKQLVLEAEHLVRDEALKTPTKQKHSSSNNNSNNTNINNSAGGVNIVQISTTVKKREVIMPGPIKRVQEWLEHQPSTPLQLQKSSHQHHNGTMDGDHHRHLTIISPNNTVPSPTRTDDCEASGEASETDSIPQHCSDTSEVSDSIATCMQTSTNSYGNSTERIGGSAEPIVNAATSNQSLNVKVVKRQQNRRKSERPWSVSCLSQLTTDANQVANKVNTISNVQSGLASHSISESALDSLSPGRPRASSSSAVNQVKCYDSKGSLKRRKTRKKKLSYNNGKKSDTNSEDNNHHPHHNTHYAYHPSVHQEEDVTLTPKQGNNLLMQTCENMTPQQMHEIQQALMQLKKSDSMDQIHQTITVQSGVTNESEEENHLMKPNFRVGSFTTAYMTNEARLGSLAALATYMNDEDQQGEYNTTGTEDHHSSFSETAWDNYQEKYNSENYSEGFDSDAARKLLEFGDDYRNFIDSQSDCCSSLSAANNLDSFSPPRMDSLQQNESKIITQDTIVSSVDHARRRRALELEYERRRKNLEIRRKSCQESLEYHNPKSPAITLSSSTQALTPKNSDRFNFQHKTETATRKLEFGMSHSAQSLRRTSESDTSQRRRKADERRRSSRNLEKCIKLIPATSSSSGDDTDDEKEIRNLLQQSHNRLEDTKALKIRCHLLRPEDYTEIINTCRDNIRCLESVLKGPTSSVLSSQCVTQSKDLLAAWEDLLGWSENAAAARKMQEDMIVLKHALNRLGNKSSFELLDTEPSIQIAIEALKNEKTQLQTYRTSMLKLNASVHSWLTRQERRLQNALVEQQLSEAAAKVSNDLLEEKDELESEHQTSGNQQINAEIAGANKQSIQEQIIDTTTTTMAAVGIEGVTKTEKTTMITVTDSNGNQVESHTTTATTTTTATNTVGTSTAAQQQQQQQQQLMMHSSSSCSGSEKNWDIQTLITSETEFHKHLKDEVSDMYTAWDEADARINTQLEVLTSSLIAWRQLECGLSEFQLALGQDRGTLKGLEGALNTGQATPGELAQNVKLVAKLLSEKVNVSQEQLTAVQDYLDPNHILHIAKFTASNGSLSDSGISDGGTTSDGGLSERERRLGVLRRLAKQLESALAPGSEAMKSIAARMESAENELKSLQNTCRDLIVRTAASHQNKKQQMQQQEASEKREVEQQQQQENKTIKPAHQTNGAIKMSHETNGKLKQLTQGESATANGNYGNQSGGKRNRRKNRRNSHNSNAVASADMSQSNALKMTSTAPGDGGDDPSDDPSLAYDMDSSDDELTPKSKRGWGWRIARIAVPMQLALFAVYYAANLMQPNCCDNINNLSMSFTPQLRYIRGPPPI
ncbi:klarsicht isoform 2-T3 [Cochliomyia hominivorax]